MMRFRQVPGRQIHVHRIREEITRWRGLCLRAEEQWWRRVRVRSRARDETSKTWLAQFGRQRIEPVFRAVQLRQWAHSLSPARDGLPIVVGVHLQSLSPLLKLIQALRAPCLRLARAERRQQ